MIWGNVGRAAKFPAVFQSVPSQLSLQEGYKSVVDSGIQLSNIRKHLNCKTNSCYNDANINI